jgi:hypothetical protein
MKYFPLIIFCIVCFLVGAFVYPQLIPVDQPEIVDMNISEIENLESHPLADPIIVEAQKMKEEIIDHLGQDYNLLLE